MARTSKKRFDRDKNRRLDAFLTQLEIEQEKKDQILKYVENLTFHTLRQKSQPKLRLKRD